MAIQKGRSGQQKKLQHLNDFQAWVLTQFSDDFNKTVFRGKFNRGEFFCCPISCGE